jgi:hypothetical protein
MRPTPGTGSFPHSPSSCLSFHHFTTKKRSSKITTNDLPMEKNAIGLLSRTGIFFACVKLTVPLAYVYIALILWRELCHSFPRTMLEGYFMTNYFQVGVWMARSMTSSSFAVEVWAVIEGLFYVILFLHRKYLNSLDTLELSLQSAPMLEIGERAELWELMMDSEDGECSKFISGWFFGEKLENLTRYDIMDFLAWSLFEGRNLEHLTQEETHQLRGFVTDLEYKISIELYGVEEEAIGKSKESENAVDCGEVINASNPPSPLTHQLTYLSDAQTGELPEDSFWVTRKGRRPQPKKPFLFPASRDESHRSYFSDLYESYKVWCDQYREMIGNGQFKSVQDFRNFVAEKTQQLHHAEQSAVATASESLQHAYFSLIEKNGMIDVGVRQAWNSMYKMKERLQTASDISTRRKALLKQLKSYRQTLAHLRSMASGVPSKQMADLMKKITQCYEALESVEKSAMDAFMQVTGYVGKNLLHGKEPPRYLK